MAKNASGEVAKKTPAKTPAKKELTLKEAFEIIRKCDGEIKEIYGTRTENDVDVTKIMDSVTLGRFIAGAGTSMLTGISGLALDIHLLEFIGSSSLLYTFFVLISCGMLNKYHWIAPIKQRKLQAEHAIHQQLIEFHEETMAEQAQVVLKKAKKALKVINAALKEDGQSVYFNTTKGEEGFVLKQPEQLDQLEMAFLRVSKKETQKKLELVRTQQNSIEALKTA